MQHTDNLNYVQSLISSISQSTPHLHAHIFTTLLLCLVSGEKNVLLRTRAEDISSVVSHVVTMLVTVFGLPTRRVQIPTSTQSYTPNLFLRSLFLVPPAIPDAGNTTPMLDSVRHKNKRPIFSKRLSVSRSEASSSSSTRGIPIPSSPPAPERRPPIRLNSSGSVPRGGKNKKRLSIPPQTGSFGADDASIRALRPQSSHGFPLLPQTPETFLSDLPLPNTPSFVHSSSTSSYASTHTPPASRSAEQPPTAFQPPRLPHVVVVTKLERASQSVQTSLTEVLRTRRIVLDNTEDEDEDEDGGTWNLPRGFFVVYVCKLGKERPPISKSLLDRFAFTSMVNIDADIGVNHLGSLRRTALVSHDDIEALQHLSAKACIRPFLDTYITSLLSAARHHPRLDAALLSLRCHRDFLDFVRTSAVIFSTRVVSQPYVHILDGGDVLSTSEKDVLRSFAGVVGHRVKIRKERDGILGSVLGGAVVRSKLDLGTKDGIGVGGGESVQSILLEIMKTV